MNVKVSARLTPTVSPKSRVMLGRYRVARQQTTIHVNVKLVSKVSSPQYKESYRMLVQYNLYYLEAPGHYYIPYIPFRVRLRFGLFSSHLWQFISPKMRPEHVYMRAQSW